MINRFFFFFLKATRETSLFKRHTCRLIIRMREAEIFQNRVLSGMDMPDHTNWFLCPPNNTGEYRSHYAAVSRNLHVTFSCIFPRDLSAGTFKLLTKKKKRKDRNRREDNVTCIVFIHLQLLQFKSNIIVGSVSLSAKKRKDEFPEGGY